MMRRRNVVRTIVVAALAVLLVALALVVAVWRREETRITDANFERIEAGMSVAEVEAILGPTRLWFRPFLSASSDGPVVTQYGVHTTLPEVWSGAQQQSGCGTSGSTGASGRMRARVTSSPRLFNGYRTHGPERCGYTWHFVSGSEPTVNEPAEE